jgi:dipeptidyl aminopeptidase/acylaminoacyl peptidase
MNSMHDQPGNHDGRTDERPDADERARRVLQAQAWPTLERPLVVAQITLQPRRQAGQWLVWTLAFGCVAALALVLVVVGSGQGRPPATILGASPGQASPTATAPSTPLPAEPSAWSEDAGLWVQDAGAPPRLLVAERNLWSGRDPIISPDGKWVGYIVLLLDKLGKFRNELRVVSWSDGSLRQRVVGNDLSIDDLSDSTARRGIFTPIWSPDSHMIAFDTISAANTSMPHGYDDLWTLDIDNGTVTRVLDEGKAATFVFSPDGTMFAVSTAGYSGTDGKSMVKVLRIDGSAERTLFEHPMIITNGEGYGAVHPHWSPDGTSLLVALPAPDPSQKLLDAYSSNAQLYRLPLDGKPELLSTLNDVAGGALNGVKWSPDTQHTAFVVTSAAPVSAATANDLTGYPAPAELFSNTALIIAGPDGRDGQTVARGPDLAFEGWLPDSRHYRYSQRSGTGPRVTTEGQLP